MNKLHGCYNLVILILSLVLLAWVLNWARNYRTSGGEQYRQRQVERIMGG